MEMIQRDPKDGIYPATPDYAHAMELRGAGSLLFVSGTMGLDQEGRPADGLEAQLALIWSNIRRILAEADMTTANVIRVTSYLREAGFVQANQDARLKALGDRRVPTTAIVVETLLPEWLVEIEVIAAA